LVEGCEYRPEDGGLFIESLNQLLSTFSLYSMSTLASHLRTLIQDSTKLQTFNEIKPLAKDIEWSMQFWKETGKFEGVPFIVQDYPHGLWKDGRRPTLGQFIKSTYQIDAHPEGLVHP